MSLHGAALRAAADALAERTAQVEASKGPESSELERLMASSLLLEEARILERQLRAIAAQLEAPK